MNTQQQIQNQSQEQQCVVPQHNWDKAPDPYEDKELLNFHVFCMKLCQFSYDPIENFVVPKEWGVTISYQPEAKPMFPIFFVVQNVSKKELYICVRGSRHPNDFWSDGNASVEDLYGSPSHKGFVLSGTNVFNNLPWSAINSALENHFKIIFTGHSLGGATAAVLLMNFARRYKDANLKCVTFGCPGVVIPELNAEWYPLIDSIIHIGDPIPFACLHNFYSGASAGVNILQAMGKAIFQSEYFPLTFLDSLGREDTAPEFKLLIPPGRIFAAGLNSFGQLKLVEYKELSFFDGFQFFLNQSCHLIAFYVKTMLRLAGLDDEHPLFYPPLNLPPDFIPAQPLNFNQEHHSYYRMQISNMPQ